MRKTLTERRNKATEERKRLTRERQKLQDEKEIQKVEAQIADFESELQGLERRIADLPKVYWKIRNGEEAMRQVLYVMFGTPDEPFAWPASGLDQKKLVRASGTADHQHNGLYRKHCAHCHGVSGDGAGPTARFLNPFPRDYRRGIFKFKSTGPTNAQPTREDLKRTIQEGINGTAMPSFKVMLREDEIDALTDYVTFLSMRGMVEQEMQGIIDDKVSDETDLADEELLPQLIAELSPRSFNVWKNAEKQVFTPPARDADMEKRIAQQNAKQLFNDKQRGNCVQCHGPAGLGDGGQKDFDDWNKPKWDALTKQRSMDDIAAMWTLPLQRAKPRNLLLGIFRGGRRPVDVYRRIAVGINGTPMPAHAASGPEDTKKLQPEEIWALVDYVLYQLPYEEDGELQRGGEREKHTPHVSGAL